jgi:hypothetical protein
MTDVRIMFAQNERTSLQRKRNSSENIMYLDIKDICDLIHHIFNLIASVQGESGLGQVKIPGQWMWQKVVTEESGCQLIK